MLMKDKYDEAMAYLFEHPEEIRDAWADPYDHVAGCLFQYATRGKPGIFEGFGCLTMVRGVCRAATQELTAAIRADERIPRSVEDATADTLPVFAEWQRRLDKELERV